MSRSLHDMAHIRTGDKGPLITISVSCHDPGDYSLLAARLTTELAARHLGERIAGVVSRYELPKIATILFVCRRHPGDTVNTSLYLDRHGKTLGFALYDIEFGESETDGVGRAQSMDSTRSMAASSDSGAGQIRHVSRCWAGLPGRSSTSGPNVSNSRKSAQA